MEEGGFGPLLLQVLRKYGENLEKKGFQYGHPNQRIDDILNCAEECQRDTRLRTTFKKKPTMKNTSMSDEQFADYLTSSIVERMPPVLNPDTLRVKEGKLASYFIRVLARQHSSMQGVINCAGLASVFRSEIEWLRLIRDDLTAECSWNKRKAGK